ncbi:hypothetical protein AB7M26_003677 [Pseudomonas sp. F-14 TE3482]|jgi:hypothetical protein
MEVDDLVDAALVGFDRREPVTIPPLHEAERWDDLQSARQGLLGKSAKLRLPSATKPYSDLLMSAAKSTIGSSERASLWPRCRSSGRPDSQPSSVFGSSAF